MSGREKQNPFRGCDLCGSELGRSHPALGGVMSEHPHAQFFGWPSIPTYNPSFWFMLKLRLFGRRLEEWSGRQRVVWYAYKGKLYLTEYGAP